MPPRQCCIRQMWRNHSRHLTNVVSYVSQETSLSFLFGFKFDILVETGRWSRVDPPTVNSPTTVRNWINCFCFCVIVFWAAETTFILTQRLWCPKHVFVCKNTGLLEQQWFLSWVLSHLSKWKASLAMEHMISSLCWIGKWTILLHPAPRSAYSFVYLRDIRSSLRSKSGT